MTRHCTIVGASIEDENGRGDGAYSLLDISGAPKPIADAIREALEEGGLTNANYPLYLSVRIRID